MKAFTFDRACRVAWLVLASILLWQIYRAQTGKPFRIQIDGIDLSVPERIIVESQ